MSAIPTFSEMRNKARREKATITCRVMMADDRIILVKFGPRGGWVFME